MDFTSLVQRQRDFFRTLVKDGLHVKVTSNRRE